MILTKYYEMKMKANPNYKIETDLFYKLTGEQL